jgi:glycogen phosphorylase
MRPLGTFLVRARLPERLARLRDVAYNLHWAWNQDAIALFRRVDADVWELVEHNPVRLLDEVGPARFEALADDEAFLAHLDVVVRQLDDYTAGASTWFGRTHPSWSGPLVAYFSAEFGVTEALPIFAGGLGVLAGDHLKAASDLGLPLVGVGLLYQQGYFRQYLDQAGWQQETYLDRDFHALPLQLERRDGQPVHVSVPHPGREVQARVWRADVGRVPLYLLDTNIEENDPRDRDITAQLYGGDLELRIRQEIVLGIGGVRALARLGLEPPLCHMNEGHSAFAALERAKGFMDRLGIGFDAAAEASAAGTIFTTHTPVAAGHDAFPPELLDRYLGDYADAIGIGRDHLLARGRTAGAGDAEPFSMTILALRLSAASNGVSRLHGQVSRAMWRGLWPDVPEEEVPIGHVTNGVHLPSWISRDMDQLYDRYLGPRWRAEPGDQAIWKRAEAIPPEELWRTHERRRERLVAFARKQLRDQLGRRGGGERESRLAEEVLDPQALTIAFARRFATYKRALLLFRDPERLSRLLNHPERPVQIIIAGKAHPRDQEGKALIRRIVELAREEPFRRRLVFLENYDLPTARYLVQGADVWLNTPRRPLEASGTSGMKAAANGVLNLSVLDGWWAEAWDMRGGRRTHAGWAIGAGEEYDDHEEQDRIEAGALYALLESEIVPAFYDRGADRLPRRWTERMRQSIARLSPVFNTNRVVAEYTERYYLPCAERAGILTADGARRAVELAAWKQRVTEAWPGVRVELVGPTPPHELPAGDELRIAAAVSLSGLGPDDVRVELCLGRVDTHGEVSWSQTIPMHPDTGHKRGGHTFRGAMDCCPSSGLHGYAVRVRPDTEDLHGALLPGLITWATPTAAPETP